MNNMNEWAAVVGRSMRPVPEHLPTRIRSVTFSAGSEAIIDRYGLKNQKISPWISRHGDAAFVLNPRFKITTFIVKGMQFVGPPLIQST
jgi:hypothetical protein